MTPPVNNDVLEIMQRRPAIHRLTYGAYIQGHLWLDERTFVVPLQPMRFDHGVDYAGHYHIEIVGVCPRRTSDHHFAWAGEGRSASYRLYLLPFR